MEYYGLCVSVFYSAITVLPELCSRPVFYSLSIYAAGKALAPATVSRNSTNTYISYDTEKAFSVPMTPSSVELSTSAGLRPQLEDMAQILVESKIGRNGGRNGLRVLERYVLLDRHGKIQERRGSNDGCMKYAFRSDVSTTLYNTRPANPGQPVNNSHLTTHSIHHGSRIDKRNDNANASV